MSQWKNIGPIVALSITAALAGTGCMAESADDESITDDTADVVVDEASAVAGDQEKTGESEQAWWGGFGGCFPFAGCGGFGGCGIGLGFPFLGGGCGLGFGGCGFGGGWGGGCGFGGGWGGCGGGWGGCGGGLGFGGCW